MVIYFFAIWVAQQSGINHDTLTDAGFPALGVLIGGHWLGIVVAAGGMASTLGIYTAVLLSVSRVPQVMSEDNLLPKGLNKLHPRFKTPFVSIIICSIVVSFMVLWTFADLLIIDVTVYGAGLSLEYVALVKLRIKEPLKERPFRIPLSVTGLCLVLLLPFIVYGVALGGALSSTPKALSAAIFALVALSSAEVAWQIIKLSRPELKTKR
jgi:amino acid transporter